MKYLFKFKDGSESIEDLEAETIDAAINIKCGTGTEGLESCSPINETSAGGPVAEEVTAPVEPAPAETTTADPSPAPAEPATSDPVPTAGEPATNG